MLPSRHPPLLGFIAPKAAEIGALKLHRDGTRSIYIIELAGNSVELLSTD